MADTDGWINRCMRILRHKRVLVILGGFFIHLPLGSYYMFGNYSPYIISYLRNRTNEASVDNVEALWVTSIGNIGLVIGMVIGGVLERKFGPRIATAVGSIMFCSSVALTYFSVQQSIYLVTLTYGFTGDLGTFIAYIPPMQAAMKWLPNRPTLATGLVLCGFGLGTLVFSQVLTAYINPDNYSPDQIIADDQKYFTQEDLLDRVPTSFLMLGGVYFAMHIVGLILLRNPPPTQAYTSNSVVIDEDTGAVTNPNNDSSEAAPLVKTRPLESYQKPVKNVIMEALRVRSTYVLWFTVLCNMFAMQLLDTVYKAYGQNYIHDDHFLALSVAISSIFNCIGRPAWGVFNDRFGYKVTLWTITAGFATMMGTFSVTERFGAGAKPGLMIWLCAIFWFYSGVWSTMPATFGNLFGTENSGITYGLTGSAIAAAALTAGLSGLELKAYIGYDGLFYLTAGIIAISFVLTFFFNGRDRDGRRI